MRGRVLIAVLLAFCLYFTAGTPPVDAQPRSDMEVIIETPENDIAMDMAVDSQGNVVVVGQSQSQSDTSPYSGKFYVVKVSSQGEVLWTRSWNVSSSDMLVSVDVDSVDNILLAGVSNLTTDQFNLTTDQVYGVLYKLDPDGEFVWSEEIPNIYYDWHYFGSYYLYFGIQTVPQSDDFLVIGSVLEGSHKTFVARYNASGSMIWCTQWYGPPESLGSLAKLSWLSSQDWIVVSGFLYGSTDPYHPYDGRFIAAFDFDGSQVWNHTTYDWGSQIDESSAVFEISTNQYVYSTSAGRAMDHIVCRTYDLNETWSFDMIVDDLYSVTVTGFLANGTDNIIGYGEIISLVAEHAVVKGYRPSYSGFQPPQSLIFSFSPQGELLWYDFLVIGRISDPCGCQFDSNRRLIVAGHTSPWSFNTQDFFVVFGFVQTPFPAHYDRFAFFVVPLLNLLALGTAWRIGRAQSKLSSLEGASQPRVTYRGIVMVLLILEVAVCAVLYQYLIAPFGGGGPPSPLVYYPDWITWFLAGLFWGLPILVIAHTVIWYRGRSVSPQTRGQSLPMSREPASN